MANIILPSATQGIIGGALSELPITAPNTSSVESFDKLNNAFTILIRDQPYYIEIFLYNQLDSDGYKPVPIPFLFVDELSIEETLLSWIVKGYIVLNSDFEVLERGSLGDKTNDKIKAPYVFRTDGRNRISLRVKPVFSGKNKETYLDTDWEMSFDCVIYDTEDMPSDSNAKKFRKYYFWDERYQLLSERNIQYSSVYSTPSNSGQTLQNLTDSQRAANPNIMLKDIITTAATNPPVMDFGITNINNVNKKSIINIGFLEISNGGTISNPTQPLANFDNANWDIGSDSNILYYTSPANSRAIDDMSYVLDHCISTANNGPVFLRFGRTTNDKKWKLISLASLFENSTKNQFERLYIEDSILPNTPYIPRASDKPIDNNVNFSSPFASRIKSYKFSHMVAADDARITNAPVHNYDFSTATHSIYFTNNTAENVRDNLQSFGKMGLYNFTSNNSNDPHVLLNLNQTKSKGIMLNNVLKPSTFFPKNFSGNKMLKDSLFLNESVSFEADGLTIRTPGKFIFIDKYSSSTDNPFDDRFLGQWLVVKVNHVFTSTSYKNEMVAVKVDTHSKLWTQKEDKY